MRRNGKSFTRLQIKKSVGGVMDNYLLTDNHLFYIIAIIGLCLVFINNLMQ